MPASNMPAAEVDIDADLARGLLSDQHPDLAELALRDLACGWDNVSYRLGDELVLRMPRRAVAAPLIRNEQRWLPELAERLPLPIAAPVRTGVPGRGYPWPWSVCPWFEGETAADAELDGQRAAVDLAGFLRALHREAPDAAPVNPVRGVPLRDREPAFHKRIEDLRDTLEARQLEVLLAFWNEGVAAPLYDGPRLWLHGDVHPANLLVRAGRLAAVLDFGDITAGDPASDLAGAWFLFDEAARSSFRAALPAADDATWRRAGGWAALLTGAFLGESADNPRMRAVGARALRHLQGLA